MAPTKSAAVRQVNDYLQEAGLPVTGDPLKWWRDIGSHKYNILATLAREYLAIPATSVPSERIWSEGGGIITEKGNNLYPDTACMLIWLHHNWDVLDL